MFSKKNTWRYSIVFLCIVLGVYSSIEPLYTPTAIPVNKQCFRFPKIIVQSSKLPGYGQDGIHDVIQTVLCNEQIDAIQIDVFISNDDILWVKKSDLVPYPLTLEAFLDKVKGKNQWYSTL